MQFLLIVILTILSAVIYGIIHDQFTARICVEYFTMGHRPVFRTESPTLLALGWGVIATWWVGLLLGIPLAIAATAGSRPKRSAASLVRPMSMLLLVMGVERRTERRRFGRCAGAASYRGVGKKEKICFKG